MSVHPWGAPMDFENRLVPAWGAVTLWRRAAIGHDVECALPFRLRTRFSAGKREAESVPLSPIPKVLNMICQFEQP